ncbi:type IV pilin [Candidatus Magnetoovum chiemensis]|nr:type IV pilin [Candidatus Magnetoovum chiemensis]
MRSEALQTIESLRLLAEDYYAENGCYSKNSGACANVTKTGISNIQALFPSFRPGSDIKFDYEFSTNNTGQNYAVTATGNYSAVEGTVICINDKKETEYNVSGHTGCPNY